MLPDEVDPEATYDEIWSNPPIRVGKDALHELLLRWLPRLRPGGRALMVVGKNLGSDSLAAWLGEQGYPTEKLASAKGFRVLESRPSLSSVDEPQRLQRAGLTARRACPSSGPGTSGSRWSPAREREAPLVGGQQLRQQLGAGAVAVTAGPVNVHAHRSSFQVLLDVVGEDAHRAGDEAGGAVGVGARAAPVDQRAQPLDLRDRPATGPGDGQPVQGVGQPGQPVDARAALAGALPGEVRAIRSLHARAGRSSRSSTCTTPAPGRRAEAREVVDGEQHVERRPGTQAPW